MKIVYRNIKDLIRHIATKDISLFEALERIHETLAIVVELLNAPKFDFIELGEIKFPDDTNLLNKRSALTQCCRLFSTENQTIANNTPTAVTFNTEIFDTDIMAGSTATRIIINTAGRYLVGAGIRWDANVNGYRLVQIVKNGTITIAAVEMMAVTGIGNITIQSLSTLYNFKRGDYIEVIVTQVSGGNLNLTSTAEHSPIFWAHREG